MNRLVSIASLKLLMHNKMLKGVGFRCYWQPALPGDVKISGIVIYNAIAISAQRVDRRFPVINRRQMDMNVEIWDGSVNFYSSTRRHTNLSIGANTLRYLGLRSNNDTLEINLTSC